MACGGNGDPAAPPENGPPPGPSTALIQGEVTHAGSGVGSVVVHLRDGPGSDREVTTPNDGTFEFSDVEPGSWAVEIVPPEYFRLADGEEAVRSVQVGEGGSTNVEVELAPHEALEVREIEAATDLYFSPSDVNVPPGTVVRWINSSNMLHTITPDGHSEWSEGIVASQGDIFEAVVNNPGSFDYLCAPHVGDGMVGVVQVQP